MGVPPAQEDQIRSILTQVASGELTAADAEVLLAGLMDAAPPAGGSSGRSGVTATRPPRPPAQPQSPATPLSDQVRRPGRELSREIRRLSREAQRMAHEARRVARRELKDSMREAKVDVDRAFHLSVVQSKQALKQVASELRRVFGETAGGPPGSDSLIASLAGLGLARDKVKHVAEQILEQETAGAERVTVRNLSGDVKITGWDRPLVQVRGERTAWGMDRETAQDRAETMPLDIQLRDGEILVEARAAIASGVGLVNLQRMHTDLEVTVPFDLPLHVTTTSGDVSVRGHAGLVEVNTSSGDIVISGASGQAIVETASGGIQLRSCRCQTLALTSLSGDIDLRLIAGAAGDYRVRSANGDVVAELAGGVPIDIVLETVSGDLGTGPRVVLRSQESSRFVGELPAGPASSPGPSPERASLKIITIKGDISVS